MYHICPVCGEETITTGCYSDSDDGGASHGLYTRSWVASEIREKTCDCALTSEQEDAILAADTCEPSDDY